MYIDLQDESSMGGILWAWSQLFAAQRLYEPAVRLIGAADVTYGKATQSVGAMYRLRMERRLDAIRSVVGAELVEAALREGSAMSLDAAIAYVRQHLSVSVPFVSSS